MKWHVRSAPTKSVDRVTVQGVFKALALGMLLGSIGIVFSQQVDAASLLYITLQSAFSTMVLAVLLPLWPRDLAIEACDGPTCPEGGYRT